MTKRKLIIISISAFLAVCVAVGIVILSVNACKSSDNQDGSSSISTEERTIKMFSVPESVTCGAGSYFIPTKYAAYDNFGMKVNSEFSVYDANRQVVALDENGGFLVQQSVGSKYYITYSVIMVRYQSLNQLQHDTFFVIAQQLLSFRQILFYCGDFPA
jgi:hypothetical protein